MIQRTALKRRALLIHAALRKEISPRRGRQIDQEDRDSEQARAAAAGTEKLVLSLLYHALHLEPQSPERDALIASFSFRPTTARYSERTKTMQYFRTPARLNPLLRFEAEALRACAVRALARIEASGSVEAIAIILLNDRIREAENRLRQEQALVLQAGETNLAMLEDARRRRWGEAPEDRLRKVQRYFNERRRKYPRVEFGITKLMEEAAGACGVSVSYIKKQRRLGLLIIPPKQP